ncbi:MAG: hypothetical protein OXG65_03870 [Chloroflexi bacterium]|nr:hypothetical protein [Chloroflexota bacterium]
MVGFSGVVEVYLADLRKIRVSGGATVETSSYTPLENLLNAVGTGLKPEVFCVGQLKDQEAGRPDSGLYASKQGQRGGQPKNDEQPEHSVVEVKSAEDDAWLTASWGQLGSGGEPEKGRVVERACTGSERSALSAAVDTLGESAYHTHQNDQAYWRNVPAKV